MFGFTDTLGAANVAFTDRYGGVSRGPYASLNLALEGRDDPAAVAENLRRVGAEFNPDGPLVGMRQVHGTTVAVVDDATAVGRAGADRPPTADGLVTAFPGVALLVRAADCVPVLLADRDGAVVGAAHAGRKGLLAGVVPATVDRMRRLGAGTLVAWVGPHICGRCYEVPAAMQEEIAAGVPAARATTSWGTPALDLAAGVRAQLEEAGAEVVDASRCTREDADLYSYRRDGALAGRLGGLVAIAR